MINTKCEGWSQGPGYFGHSCDKDLKTDEQVKAGLCGRHLAGRHRVIANNKWQDEERVRSEELRVKAEGVVARLAKLDVKAAPHYSTHGSRYTGGVVIEDGEALMDLIDLVQWTRRSS